MSKKIDIEKLEKCDIKDVIDFDQCKLKIVDGKAIVECPTPEAVADAVVAISKGVSVVQVDVKPIIEKTKQKKA